MLNERDGTNLPNNWLHQLNLDPRHRITAGFGTRVVQEKQEDLMDAAWRQVLDWTRSQFRAGARIHPLALCERFDLSFSLRGGIFGDMPAWKDFFETMAKAGLYPAAVW